MFRHNYSILLVSKIIQIIFILPENTGKIQRKTDLFDTDSDDEESQSESDDEEIQSLVRKAIRKQKQKKGRGQEVEVSDEI